MADPPERETPLSNGADPAEPAEAPAPRPTLAQRRHDPAAHTFPPHTPISPPRSHTQRGEGRAAPGLHGGAMAAETETETVLVTGGSG